MTDSLTETDKDTSAKTADGEPQPDMANSPTGRYVTFSHIDFPGNIQAVMDHLFHYINDPEKTNPLWERFKERLAKANNDAVPAADVLLLLHSHVYFMYDLFEEYEDEAALEALAKLEQQCF